MGSDEFLCCVTWFILSHESASKANRTELQVYNNIEHYSKPDTYHRTSGGLPGYACTDK